MGILWWAASMPMKLCLLFWKIFLAKRKILRKGEETARDLGTTTVGANRKEEMPGRKREGSPTQYGKKEERRKPEPAKGKGESSLKNTKVATQEGIAFTVESGKHERDGGKIPEESMDPNELMMAHFEIGKTLWVHKIKGPDSNLFSVAMKIEGEERRVTVDSAASKSLVSINLINKEKLLPCAYEIIAANDMAIDLLGQVTLQISSEGEDWVHTFLVHNQKSPAVEILLGNDFHYKFGTDISFRKNQCTIRETVLEAGKDSKIKIEIGPYKPKTLMHFKPKDIFGGRIMPWEILLYPDEDEISVTNLAPFDITLPKDTKLGSLGAPQGLQYTKDTKGRMPQALVNLLRIDKAPSVKQKKGENSGQIEEEKALNINPALKEDDRQKLNDLLEKYEDVFVRPGNPLQITNILKVRLPLKDPDKVIYQQNYPIPPALDKSTTKVIFDLIKEDVLERAPHSNYRIPYMIVEKGRDKNNQMQYRLVLSAKKLNECLARLVFDSTLSWNDHCIKIAQKVFGTLAQLKRNFSYLPVKIRKLLVTSLVFSNIDYGSVLLTDLSVVNVDGEGYKPDPRKFRELEKLFEAKTRRQAKYIFHYFSRYRAFIKDFHKISKPILNAADPAEGFSWGPEQREVVKLLHKKLLMDVTLMHFNADLETVLACDGSPVYGVGAVLYQKCPVLRKFRPVAVYSKQFPKSQRNSSAHDAELLALYYSLQRFRMELHAVKEFTIKTDCISLQFLDGLSHPSARQARVQIYLTQFYGKYKLKYKPGRLQTCPDFHSRNPDDLEGYNPLEAEEDAWKLPDEEISRPDICKNGQNQSITLHGNEEDLTITAQVLEDKLKKAKGHVFAVTRAVAKRLKEEAKGKKEEIVLPGVTIPVKEVWRAELMKAQASDKGIKEIKSKIENGDVEENCIIDGIVCKFRTLDNKRQPVIIVPPSLRKKILENCHDSILGEHYGVKKTLALIESTYWCRDMKKDTRDYVKSCQACGEFKPKLTKDGLLQPIIATRPFQIMGCDFMEMGTSKQGCRWGFALVDLFSGFVYVKPSKRNRSRDASHAFKDLLGIIMVPEVLICDRGPHFTATDFQEFVERLGVKELNIVPPRVHHSNVENLQQAITPACFDFCIDAAMEVAGYEKKAIKEQDKNLQASVEGFLKLRELDWSNKVSKKASLQLKEDRYNKPEALTDKEDVIKLADYLVHKTNQAVQKLEDCPTAVSFNSLANITLTRVILLNRKRPGDVHRLTIADYSSVPVNHHTHTDIWNSLDGEEQARVQSLKRVETRDKKFMKVLILFTPIMQEAVELLIKHRSQCGVLDSNQFLFPNVGCETHLRGSDAVRKCATDAGCSNRSRMTYTCLRKGAATLAKVAGLTETKMRELADFLGHTFDVHKQHYQLPQRTLQTAKVSKYLLQISKESAKAIGGEVESEESEGEVDNPEQEQQQNEVQDHPSHLAKQPAKRQRALNNPDSESDSDFTTSTKKKTFTKRKWDTPQRNAVLKHCRSFIAPMSSKLVVLSSL
ncbi:Retrovirus-related Pol polyprotein from transposon opus [Frankliniella fusca]|uniref:Retrovirus-related Pol polyprotein from transposon opus n=1 Tax=Frankliniella fusca TaxID=407009 RepID=A0AAE1LG71_9NEOP|nr:Retrovirus-related Pol polyprotein from transposon opus [Frankliniella fusca]